MPNLNELSSIWVYLSASPLMGLTLTLCAYVIAFSIYRHAGFSPLANPVAMAIALIVAILALTGTSYQRYFSGAQFVHFLLGPATVALAIPLARQVGRLKRNFFALMAGLLAGSATAILSSISLVALFGGGRPLAVSAAPKSATTPIAMAVAEKFDGLPALTAVLVISTGIFGAISARFLFNMLRIRTPEIRGFALGVASHGIGTARAFQASEVSGAFASIGMALNGMLTAMLLPALVALLP